MSSELKEPFSVKLKRALDVILGLLNLINFIPFLGQWRAIVVALIAVLGALSGALGKCAKEGETPSKTVTQTPTPVAPPPTPSPTPSPTPIPEEIIVPERIVQREPFVVRVSSKFNYNVSLNVDRFHLCILGQEYRTRYYSCTVTLWTAGKRVLRVTLPSGKKLERWIDVEEAPRSRAESTRYRVVPK